MPATRVRLVAAAVLWLAVVAPGPVAGASNALTAGKVMPATGTTETSFAFSVTYTSPQGFPATRVVARTASRTVELVLFSGSAADGAWRGTSRLPAGSWPVTFEATAAQGKNPTLAGPTVTVTAVPATTPPTATPRATAAPAPPTPTPAVPAAAAPPTPAPQPVVPAPAGSSAPGLVSPSAQASPSGAASPASPGAGGGVVVGTPGGAVTPAARADEVADGPPWTLLMVAAAVIALIAGIWLLGLVGRRRRSRGGPTSEVPPVPPVVVAAAPAARPLAEWELASLDDEPIGTVDYPGRA